jgi:hypothetical protein
MEQAHAARDQEQVGGVASVPQSPAHGIMELPECTASVGEGSRAVEDEDGRSVVDEDEGAVFGAWLPVRQRMSPLVR